MRYRQHIALLVIVLFAALLVEPCIAQPASPDANPSTLRCALIDVDQSALAGLVEADLITRSGEVWLERTEINRLLEEKQLQSLLSAGAGDDRIALGQTLKADVLVMLRTKKEQEKTTAELVVAETNQGLRLLTQSVVLDENIEEHSATLVELIDQAIAKARQEIRQVFAVPPFVSDDLTYEHDYLKSTYAKLLEQSLLDSPGVLIVELEEAQAIASERSLTAESGTIKRRLPIYLLGQFRNEGQGETRQVQISLSVQQGSKELDKLQAELRPAAAAEFLRESAQKVSLAQGIESIMVAPAIEAQQLNKRARQFARLGDWAEALGLIEASLMLYADQPEVISEAIGISESLANTYSDVELDEVEKAKELHRRVLKHLQTLALKYSPQQCYAHLDSLRFNHRNHLKSHDAGTALSDKLAALEDVYREEKRELVMQLVHQFAEAGDLRTSSFLLRLVGGVSVPSVHYATLTQMILKYQDQPNADQVARSFATGGNSAHVLKSLEGRKFLQQLKEHPEANAKVRQAAEQLIQEIGMPVEARKFRTSGDPDNKTELTFKPLDLSFEDQRGSKQKLTYVDGCIPLDDGSDLFYGRDGVFLLTEEEGLQKLWEEGPRTTVESVACDGRYVWSTGNGEGKAPVVRVFDLQTGNTTQFTKEDGLPLLRFDEIPGENHISPIVRLATVGPGRAILAGYVGRTWLADVKIDEAGRQQVKIFHEAKEVVPPSEEMPDLQNINVAFQPSIVRTLVNPDKSGEPRQVVMIFRGGTSYGYSTSPLIIDPQDLSIRVAEDQFRNPTSGREPKNVYQGSHYYAGAMPPKFDSIGLIRTQLPALQLEVAIPDIREGEVVFNRSGEVNVVGADWQRGRIEDGKLQSYGPVPWLYNNHWGASEQLPMSRFVRGSFRMEVLADSNHFGTFIRCQETEGPTGLVQVLFDGSGTSLKEALNGPSEVRVKTQVPVVATQSTPVEDRSIRTDPPRCIDLAYSPDGQLLVTTSRNAADGVQVWDAESGELLAKLPTEDRGAKMVVFSHDGKTFTTCDSQGHVVVWDTQTLQPVVQCEGVWEKLECLTYSWADDRLAASSADAACLAWSLPDGKLLYEQKERRGGARWFGFNSDDSMLIAQYYSSASAFSATDGSFIGAIESIENVGGVLDDRSLVVVGREADNHLMKWNSVDATVEELWPRMKGIPVAVSSDGSRLAKYIREEFVDNSRKEVYRVEVWDLPTKTKLAAVDGLFANKYVFTPNLDALLIVLSRGGIERLGLPAKGTPQGQIVPTVSTMRTWTDLTGKHTREGIFHRVQGQYVELKTSQGESVFVPLDRLSPDDQKFVREQNAR